MVWSQQWADDLAPYVAGIIRTEQGNWMLGELGREGLIACIEDVWAPFNRMSGGEREYFYQAVYQQLFS